MSKGWVSIHRSAILCVREPVHITLRFLNMMQEFQLVAVLILSGFVQSGIINKLTLETELNSYTDRVRIIYSLLAKECRDWRQHEIQKRNVMISSEHLDVEKRLYNELMDELTLCRDKNRPRPTTTSKTSTTSTTKTTASTTSTATSTTTTTPTTTTELPNPIECHNAKNFTEYWRLEHRAQNLKPGGAHSFGDYACDYYTLQWFRFTGAAGQRMLDRCPPAESCGTYMPLWTDIQLPDNVGGRAEGQFYVSYDGHCKHMTHNLSVIRCSEEPADVVYLHHYAPRGDCWAAFCGMKL